MQAFPLSHSLGKVTISGMRTHLKIYHTNLATKLTKKETAREKKNDLETEEFASAVKQVEEYERQRDVYTSTLDTSLQPDTRKEN